MFKALATAVFASALLLASVGLCPAQAKKARQSDTELRLDIEGRGSVVIRLFTAEAPKTTAQIIRLVREGFYNGQRFHRVEKTPKPYLIQVGDPASKTGDINEPSIGSGGSGHPMPYEDSGHQNVAGAVGLARSVDKEDSGDSQFYILLGTSKFLDGHYTVFGQVVSGMDVVNRVEKGDRISQAVILTG